MSRRSDRESLFLDGLSGDNEGSFFAPEGAGRGGGAGREGERESAEDRARVRLITAASPITRHRSRRSEKGK